MAILLVKATNATHTDATKDARGCYKRGDVVEVFDDDKPIVLPPAPPFVIIRVRSGDSGTLASGINGTTATLTLTAGQGAVFQAPPFFASLGTPFAVAPFEVVRVTARAGDVFTAVRGIRGTQRAWDAGTPLERIITKAATLKYLDSERAEPGSVVLRRRLWRINVDDLPPAFLTALQNDRYVEATWPQVRNFIQNKVTLATET